METVEACFKISFTPDQWKDAERYVTDMKNHPERVYWRGKEGMSDQQLVYAHIAHRVLSGFYGNYNPFTVQQIRGMRTSSS